ncbi:MAG: DNA mismatch repair protein MutS [Elusimicrobia bacterium ADurb.Bin231]|nr:MAG: DNA mismatch repair protein MutS [Elusimicrobia bacterium ADurb.Bin231]
MPENTPLMEQYNRLKAMHRDSILFFRLGDFYEMFSDDARTASKILNLTLTARQGIPMCGVPHHSAKYYIARLIKEGFTVAIADQMEDPSKVKGLVKREVVRVITSGTLLDENFLESKTNNFLCAVSPLQNGYSVALSDVSTGEFVYQHITNDVSGRKLSILLVRFNPAEIILPISSKTNGMLCKIIANFTASVKFVEDINFASGINSGKLAGFDLDMPDNTEELSACIAVVIYIEKTQPGVLQSIKKIKKISSSDYMQLDELAVRNLELVKGISTGTRGNSLFEAIDRTITPMGGRLLNKSILEPLLDVSEISERQDAVEFFIRNDLLRLEIRDVLKNFQDVERILSKLSAQTANAKDLVALKNSLKTVPTIKVKISHALKSAELLGDSFLVRDGVSNLSEIIEVISLIEKAVVDEPPHTVKEGGIIKDSYSTDLDELRSVSRNAKDWILAFESQEKERTGIQSLKVKYNSVFGYFIEVTKSNLDKVPSDYVRKQTISTGERFITESLKQKESMILGSQERIANLEYDIFDGIRLKVLHYIKEIQSIAAAIASLDLFASLAEIAVENDYVRPKINNGKMLVIKDGRHPVIERVLGNNFVPNDVLLDSSRRIAVITGPNMSGKSTYLRQTALIAILAQMGSFVPAAEADIGIIDAIFTRIGASDRLSHGESTFMVEMKEVAAILANVTPRSIILLDEVGRGTSTFDGISIAWSVLEYLRPFGAFVLFATHYFELTELSNIHPEIINLNVAVKEWKGDVLFLHKIINGSADKSYGIHVAKIAGLPEKVLSRSKQLLTFFENNYSKKDDAQPELFSCTPQAKDVSASSDVEDEIESLDIDGLAPKQALEKIYYWKKKLLEEN